MAEQQTIFIEQAEQAIRLLPKMPNRHGLNTGPIGKMITVQGVAEGLSELGVLVFLRM
ncbi:MAG: hypothetical protein ACI9QV_001507 [Methylophagaceae bacterium]|jgi:hypothetical protein